MLPLCIYVEVTDKQLDYQLAAQARDKFGGSQDMSGILESGDL